MASAAFAGKLEAFRQAAVLASPAQVRELQTLLQAARTLFAARSTAPTAPSLRAAIEAYEKAEGLPVTGLATHGAAEAAGRHGPCRVERPKAPRKARS